MKKGLVGRVVVLFIGIAFVIWGFCLAALGMFGERGAATLTSISRQGGERNDGAPGRYTYSIGYTFTLANGRQIDGTATIISGAIYSKAEGTSTIGIRYLGALPWINAPAEMTKLNISQPLLVCVGIFLIWAMTKKPSKRGKF